MRVLQLYRFPIGTKIPFEKWPGIIEEFLHSQNLSHRIFHYCLENFDLSNHYRSILDGTKCKTCMAPHYACEVCCEEAENALRKGTGCQRAVKEHAFLGPIQIRKTKYEVIQSLHNFSEESKDSKEAIYAILSKIYRRYGFSETSLIYRDIDFFSKRVPTPAPTADNLMSGYAGSGITLYRSCISNDNAIMLTVESHYPGEVPDASPYADALSRLLPGIKLLSATEIIMEKEEQARYEQMHSQAKPLVEQALKFFADRMPNNEEDRNPAKLANMASQLKKFCKQYGYTYWGYNYYIYFLEKKLPNGHYICLEFVSHPRCASADPYVSLSGLGFHHQIWAGSFSPQNAQEATQYLTRFFDALEEAEQTVFPSILNLYPTTPDWFIPGH